MGWASAASRRHVDSARIGFGIADEFGNSPGRNQWIHHHDVWRTDDARDRRDVANEIEVELFIEMRSSGLIASRMKLRDIHILMAVAQAGSMNKAAVALNMTQPAVSRSIA